MLDTIIIAVSCLGLVAAVYFIALPVSDRLRRSKYDPDCPHCQVLMEMDEARINR